MVILDSDPVAAQLAVDEPDDLGFKHWLPRRLTTDQTAIEQIYADLPARFPPLFEVLLRSYRWAQVDLRRYRLIANPPGPGLGGFLQRMFKDSALRKCLIPAGYMQFGMGPDLDYDPVCFDIRSSRLLINA